MSIFLVLLLVGSILLLYSFVAYNPTEKLSSDVFIGVDVAYDDIKAIKELINEISPYTNTFVIGSTGITTNPTKLDDVGQYLFDKEMYFIIYYEMPPPIEVLEEYKTRWGERLLGFYAHDEIGGRQLDLYEYRFVWEADNYTHAATQFVSKLDALLEDHYNRSSNFRLFMSDYALYWFDYKAGFDTIFAEFGWNYSRPLNVALNRGAGTVQNKDWGVMITWTYTNPPYIASGEELYNDLVYAYDNGAKYILVFDTNENYTQGILKEEHLEALEKFWEFKQDNPRGEMLSSDRVAYVLPKDYAYGFRGPDDKIWGLWEADDLSLEISTTLNSALNEYGTKLDIIYEDGLEPDNTYDYKKLIFWNGTIFYS
ncbi:MAG: hypothetical protein ACXACB_00135 [Promethearchaeota archaeon]